jgi:hypothetical protein
MGYLSIDALTRVFGGYLHQDWGDEFASVSDALAAAVAGNPGSIPAAIAEIDELLLADLSEVQLWAFMVGAHCSYIPESDGRTCREFLQYVRETLAAG